MLSASKVTRGHKYANYWLRKEPTALKFGEGDNWTWLMSCR